MPDDLPDYQTPFYEPIGKYIMSFGFLEKEVDNSIGRLLLTHERQSEAVTSQISSLYSRINLIKRLVYLLVHSEELRKTADEITTELKEQNIFRNRLVHGPINAYFIEDGYWQKIRFDRQDFKHKTFELRVTDIVSKTAACIQLTGRLANFSIAVVHAHNEQIERIGWKGKPHPHSWHVLQVSL